MNYSLGINLIVVHINFFSKIVNWINQMAKHTKESSDKVRLEKSDERYTLKGMLQDELYNLTHLERRRFFYTAWDLTVRPAESIKMVLTGHKKYLYPYFNYLILIGTITIFLSVRYQFFVSGYDIGEQSDWAGNLLDSMGFNRQFRIDFFKYAEEFATIVNIVAIPFFCLFSCLLFPQSKFNTAEHFIINVYIAAQQLLFLLLFIPFLEMWPINRDITIAIYTGLTILYNIWVYATIFVGKLWTNILKAALAIGLAFFVQTPFNYGVFYFVRPFIKWMDAIF